MELNQLKYSCNNVDTGSTAASRMQLQRHYSHIMHVAAEKTKAEVFMQLQKLQLHYIYMYYVDTEIVAVDTLWTETKATDDEYRQRNYSYIIHVATETKATVLMKLQKPQLRYICSYRNCRQIVDRNYINYT